VAVSASIFRLAKGNHENSRKRANYGTNLKFTDGLIQLKSLDESNPERLGVGRDAKDSYGQDGEGIETRVVSKSDDDRTPD